MSLEKPELRKHYFLDQYVIIAPKRSGRPRDVSSPEGVPSSPPCTFCFERLEKEHKVIMCGEVDGVCEIPVIENDFPAVSTNNPNAYGKQEVVIETSQHNVALSALPEEHIARLLDVYAQRIDNLHKSKKLEYILIFKNEGGKAGASLHHAHSQIFSSAIVPPDLLEESQKAHQYRVSHGNCPYCDIVTKESKGPRTIFSDDCAVAFSPYASQFNYEAWILPRRHMDNLTQLTPEERLSFAKALKLILSKLDELNYAYNFYLHDVVRNKKQHFYLKIIPRGSIWAGVELGSGLVINPIVPEEAAEFYRK